MNFSAEKAGRKWPYRRAGRTRAAILAVGVTALLAVSPSGPAAARQSGLIPWSGLFEQSRPRPRRAVRPALVPLPKARPADAPLTTTDKSATETHSPGTGDKPAEQATAPAPAQPSACRLALSDAIAIAPSIPDIHEPGGCGGEDLVRLEAVVLPDKRQVALKPAATLRCTMASAIAEWIRADMAPLAARMGSTISDLDNFDSFECRGRNRIAGAKLSEHGRANALDVRALKLANGQAIALTDRTVPREMRENILHSVCARFTTVLGPGSDGYHEDHIHLDLIERHNNYRICQWDVWDPLPRLAPLLPAERPDQAPPREAAVKSDAAPAKPDAAQSGASEQGDRGSAGPTKKRRQNRRF
jgi:hypothetical protein